MHSKHFLPYLGLDGMIFMEGKQPDVPIATFLLLWFESAFFDLLQLLVHSLFQKKFRDDFGVIHLSKFK